MLALSALCPTALGGSPPDIHHILLEVKDIGRSVPFYRDLLGLTLKSQSKDFATLEAGNMGVFLRTWSWDWEATQKSDERRGLGMYPHLEVKDIAQVINQARKDGYKIAQEPHAYDWGTEAFVSDPDGYTWALITLAQQR